MDLIAGISVSCLGHRYPAVEKAIKKQLKKYWHTLVYGEYILSPQVKLAELLTQQLPEQLDNIYFVNSGSEATEGAMKLAKRATGRAEIIACKKAYHGSTQGSASLMSPTEFTQAYYPLLPGIKHIDFNCEFCLRKITQRTAAVIIEPVQAEWGVRSPINNYLHKLREKCNQTGTLLIFDEIQTGYGRTGALFAFKKYGIVPDIILMAKGMGGGMPIGAFVSSKALMSNLAQDPILGHITTFGGHPVTCAAAHATLHTLLHTPHIEAVRKKEQLFRSLLQHPKIIEVRSDGLLMAVELNSFDYLQRVIKYCLNKGIITDWFLFNSKAMRIAPPLIISEEEIREACRVILEALDRVD